MKGPCSLIDSSSSSSSNPPDDYEVFLSFRGETGKAFTSHLYKALDLKGFYTFLDVIRLERGEDISTGLDNAIEGSRCAVVILSGNYASSRWCMDELVQILKCRKDSNIKQIVLPIFYHVNPDDILKQKGTIWEGFQSLKHEFPDNEEKVKSWRDALIQLPNIAGHHVHHGTIEAQFIEDFIEVVSSKLFDPALLNISEDLVGMESRLVKLKLCVSRSRSSFGDVRFIGICGLGGLGKTTLAEAYMKYMSCQFQAISFLANIREVCEKEHDDGIVRLQKQLLTDVLKGEHTVNNVSQGKGIISRRLRGKKILVVLDDVDQLDQLEGLAQKKIWFGDGSQIIVTTRDESLLPRQYEEEEYIIHKVDELEDSEALQLFSSKAFKRDCPPEDYTELSAKVIKYASGLPLALVVLGSFLRRKTRDQWKSALDRLKEYPDKKIMRVLRISFDGLEETEKNIFLDIACFFNGFRKDEVMNIMDCCGFYPEIGIGSLVDKSLLYMDRDGNRLWMHDLLGEMGKEIVREESRNEPGRRSRIWLLKDFYHVMNNHTGTEEVEAIVCNRKEVVKNLNLIGFSNRKKLRLHLGGFSNMKKLRLLIIDGMDFMLSETDRFPDNGYLSNELWFLRWDGFPLKSFPRSFQPHGLVELSIRSNVMERLWDNPMMELLYNLKSIDLNSRAIRKLENFRLFPNLEKLKLDWCNHLEEIDPSISVLKRLTLLSLECCSSLESLPTSMAGLKSLKVLNLSRCSRLTSLGPQLPDSLERINVNYCAKLHTFLDPLSQCNLHCSQIYCMGYFELVNRQGSKRTAITSLGRYLQNPPKPSERFDIVLPGIGIPSWFTHKVIGGLSSISLPLDQNWCTSKWMGFALSVSCTTSLIEGFWEIKINQEDWGFGHVHPPAKTYRDNHSWLLYLPRDTYFRSEWHEKFGHIQFTFNYPWQKEIMKIFMKFKQCGADVMGGERNKQCGARLVYEQDIEELNLIARDEPRTARRG